MHGLGRERFDAVLFDMDGVVTDTAVAHAAAWKRLFDAFLERHARDSDTPFRPFDTGDEYRRYVDGKPRYDGVRDFLASRGITLPEGDPADGPDAATVCGLGNRKDGYFNDWLGSNRVRAFPGTVELVEALRADGVKVAVFTASRNGEAVLRSAGLGDTFDARIDGVEADELQIPGKPEPAMLLRAAQKLEVAPGRAVIVEDALAGVEAGRAGGFAWVVGIDRGEQREALAAHADLVVNDLAELRLDDGLQLKTLPALPAVWSRCDVLADRLRGRRLAVLLDYDGTLTPIVSDYRKATLDESMRATLRSLAEVATVGVVSGRDLANVRDLVDVDGLHYAGSHGFELAGPGGWHEVMEGAAGFLPDLDAAERELERALAAIPGHALERKRFTIAVHFRNVAAERADEVADVVDSVLAQFPRLRKGHGKMVFELQPRLDWDKGRAIGWLLERLELTGAGVAAVYVGDDITDEAAFRVLREPNLSVAINDGERATAADYALADCDDVQRFLQWLGELARQR